MKKIYLVVACFNLFQLAFGQGDVEFNFGGNYKDCRVHDVEIDKDDNFITTGVFLSYNKNDSLGGLAISYENRNLIRKTLYNSGGFVAKFKPNKEIQWLITFENAGSKNHVLVDDSSNVYLIGKFYQKITFDSNNILYSSTGDIFVAKYTSEGKLKWAKKYLGSSDDGTLKPKIDSQGNLHIIGKYKNTLEVEGKQILKTTGNNPEPYILKLDRNGNYIWAKSFNENLALNAISVNSKSEVFIVGDFKGSLTINGNILESEGVEDIFYAKYDKNGQFLWVKTIAGKVEDKCHNIETDKLGNVYLAGIMSDNAKFDMLNVNIKTTNGKSIFVAKINDTDGKMDWVKNISYLKDIDATHFTTVQLLKLNTNGEPYIFGTMINSLSIESKEIINVNGLFRYIVKFDTQGKLISATPKVDNSTSASTYITSMTIDSKRNIYVSGYTSYIRVGNSYGFLKTNVELYESSCNNKNVSIIRNYNLSGNLTLSDAILDNYNFNYQWYKNGEAISNATQALFQAKEAGYYSLKLINKTNTSCQVSSSNTILIYPSVNPFPVQISIFNQGKYLYITSFDDRFFLKGKIEWYRNDTLVKVVSPNTNTNSDYFYSSDGIYKVKRYYDEGNIIKESNEVNIKNGLALQISKGIFYDDQDYCKPVPFLKPTWGENDNNMLINDPNNKFQWFLNGQLIKDSTNAHFKPIITGEYNVSIFFPSENKTYTSGKYKIVAEDFPKSLPISKIEDNCGAQALLKIDDSFVQRFGYESIIWRKDDKIIPEATQPFLRVNKGGFYTFSVQYKEPNTGKTCNYNSFINYERKNDFKLNLGYAYAGSGCVIDSFKVFTEQNTKYNYTWTKNDVPIVGQNSNEIFIKDKARYKGIIKRDDGCINETDEINLKGCASEEYDKFLLINPPKINADKLFIKSDEISTLSVEGCTNVDFQWLKDTKLIAEATQTSLKVQDSGKYAIQLSKMGCIVISNSIEIIVEPILGVGEVKEAFEVEVYPNPTEEQLQVNLSSFNSNSTRARLMDILGREVIDWGILKAEQNYLDLGSLKGGAYLLLLEKESKRVVKKIIKK